MVGTTPASLSKYEKGEEILSKEVLEKLFKVLQISSKRN
jgi:transcriptional regulator with XRE-family HTH domain